MDKRFEPIGGMFQGVRGSTDVGGSGMAAKLVKLNKEGVVDKSCLPAGVAESGSLSDRLDAEIRDRSEADTDLGLRQADMENRTRGRLDSLEDSAASMSDDIECLERKHEEDVASIRSDIDGVTTTVANDGARIDSNESKIASAEESLASLSERVSMVELSIESIASSVEGDKGEIGVVKLSVSQLSSSVSVIQDTVTSFSSTIVDMQSSIATTNSSMEAFKTTTLERLNSMQNEIDDLKVLVTAVYDKIMECNPE